MATNTLYLTGTYPQPSETFIEQEIQLLLKNGLPVVPVAIFRGDGNGAIADMTYLCDTPSSSTAKEGKSALKDLLKGPLRKMISLRKHHDKLEALSELVAKHKVDHLCAAFGGLPALLCAEIAKKNGISYSVSVHANDILCSPYDDQSMLESADKVFACNHRTLNELVKRAPWTKDKVHYVPHGLCLDDWPFTPPKALQSPLHFLFVGRLTEKKDPLRARDLIAALNTSGISSTITFAGDGPLKTEGMNVTGFISREAVRVEMAKSDFLLCTSVERPDGDMEGIPNVILEAMATGLPVIAPLTGGIGEVLNETTGYPFDPGNTEPFIAMVRSILEDMETLERRCQSARDLVSEAFSAEKTILEKVRYFSEV